MQWISSREAHACLIAGALFGGTAAFAVDPLRAAACGALFAFAAVIAIIDSRALIIPDMLLAPMALAGLFVRLIAAPEAATLLDCLVGALLGGGSFYLIRAIYGALRKRDGLGLGDVKLAAVAGIWLPAALLPVWVLVAASAALLGILAVAVTGRGPAVTGATAIPFGTFLAPALWIVWTCEAVFGSDRLVDLLAG